MIAKKLLTTIAFAFVLLFSGCAEDDFNEVDGLCPIVVSTVPEDGDIDVPLNQVITATFNEIMNPATITGASFTVSANGALIAGTVTYNNLTATFTPSSLLDEDTEYTGTITTLAKDPRGNALQENYVWSFITVAPLPEFSVDVSSNPTIGGITTGGGLFDQGTAVTVSALPNAGYTFTNWTENGTQVSTSPNYQFVIVADRTLVANYTLIPPTQFSVTLSSNPAEGGSTTGSGSFDEGTNVTVTATANTGYTFVNWTLAGVQVSTNPNYTFALNANKALVANFKINTYTLQVIAVNGTVLVVPLQTTYNHGATVVLTPTANSGYQFNSWSGDASGNNNPLTVVMTGNKIITANFTLITPTQFSVVLSANPNDGGSTIGAGLFDSGSTVQVSASPNSGYTFDNWTDNNVVVSSNSTYEFVLTQNRTLVANFTLLPEFSVDVSSNPTIGGITTGGGLFDQGTAVTVSAVPNVGYTFTNWTENGTQVSTSPNYQFVIIADRTLVANYTLIPSTQFAVTLSSNPTEGGSTTGSGSFDAGTNVTVTATANTGYSFVNWTVAGVQVSTNSNYTFALNANKALVANFVLKTYTLQVIAVNGTVLVVPAQDTYNHGDTVVLTPTANSGYEFTSWSGDATGNNNPLTVVMNSNKIITANFSPETFTLNVTAVNGTVTKNPNSPTYNNGTNVVLTAIPNLGYQFTAWSGDATGTNNPLTVLMNANKNILAYFSLITTPPPTAGSLCPSPAVDLGLAGNYAILAESAISTTGTTSVTGNMGISPLAASSISGFGLILDSSGTFSTSSLVTGRVYAADYTAPTPSNLTVTVDNMHTAFTTANGLAPNFTEYLAGNLNNVTLDPGVYKFGTGLSLTNTITLDGKGTDCAAFVFQIAGSLTVNPNTKIILINGAKADNIFWVVAGAGATLNTDVDFSGTILSKTLISLAQRTVVKGRLLAQTAVSLIGNSVVKPSN